MEQVLYVDVGVPHAHVILVEVVVELSDTTNILSKLIANVGTDTTIVRRVEQVIEMTADSGLTNLCIRCHTKHQSTDSHYNLFHNFLSFKN